MLLSIVWEGAEEKVVYLLNFISTMYVLQINFSFQKTRISYISVILSHK